MAIDIADMVVGLKVLLEIVGRSNSSAGGGTQSKGGISPRKIQSSTGDGDKFSGGRAWYQNESTIPTAGNSSTLAGGQGGIKTSMEGADPGSGGGGGGYYGGAGGDGYFCNGGGGSGYINISRLTNALMYGYNVPTSSATATKTYSTTNVSETPTSNYAKSGNGAARITPIN